MDEPGLLLLLLLLLVPPCPADEYQEETIKEETIKEETYETPACNYEMLHNISLLVCRIRTASGRGDECRLTYQNNRTWSGFDQHQCDSRFKLYIHEQSVTLHMSSLTPADSGNVSCDCSGLHGYSLRIGLTVVEAPANRSSNSSAEEVAPPASGVAAAWAAAAAGLLVAVAMMGCLILLLLRLQRRNRAESPRNQPELDCDDVQPYSTFFHTQTGLYSTLQIQPPPPPVFTDSPVSISNN